MSPDLDRRKFIGLFSGLGAAALLAPEVLAQEEVEKVALAAIEQAEALTGLRFTPEERELMAEGVAEHRESFRKLREIPLANSVPPAVRFSPLLPGRTPPAGEGVMMATPVRDVRRVEGPDLAYLPVTHLAALVRDRQITSSELTRFYLERLKRLNEKLFCVISYTDKLAMEQAARADREIAAGKYRGPLHGIPYGLKDLFAVPSYRTTWGAMPYREQILPETSTVARKLEEAGAVLIAKTSVGALAWGDVWFEATTKNPWNLEQGSSGSSAGSAAGTSAGCFGFSIGTETLGSIISPSHRCGVTGLRPTFGRVSRHGAMALSWTMDKVGPLCRQVEDCVLVLHAIRGSDGHDPCVIDAPLAWDARSDATRLRLGYDAEAFEQDNPDRKLQDAALAKLRSMGFALRPVKLPDLPAGDLLFILESEAAAAFDDLTRSGRDDLLVRQIANAWPNVFRAARLVPAVEYINANRARTLLMERMERVFDTVDAYVHPTYAGGTLLAANLTGHPSVIVPNGFREDGTPSSITFTGNLFREGELCRVAKAYQDATGFHRRRPLH